MTAEIGNWGIRKRKRERWVPRIKFENGMGRLAQGSDIIQVFALDRWKVSPDLVPL